MSGSSFCIHKCHPYFITGWISHKMIDHSKSPLFNPSDKNTHQLNRVSQSINHPGNQSIQWTTNQRIGEIVGCNKPQIAMQQKISTIPKTRFVHVEWYSDRPQKTGTHFHRTVRSSMSAMLKYGSKPLWVHMGPLCQWCQNPRSGSRVSDLCWWSNWLLST